MIEELGDSIEALQEIKGTGLRETEEEEVKLVESIKEDLMEKKGACLLLLCNEQRTPCCSCSSIWNNQHSKVIKSKLTNNINTNSSEFSVQEVLSPTSKYSPRWDSEQGLVLEGPK